MGVHVSQKKLAGRRCELKYELKSIRQEAQLGGGTYLYLLKSVYDF